MAVSLLRGSRSLRPSESRTPRVPRPASSSARTRRFADALESAPRALPGYPALRSRGRSPSASCTWARWPAPVGYESPRPLLTRATDAGGEVPGAAQGAGCDTFSHQRGRRDQSRHAVRTLVLTPITSIDGRQSLIGGTTSRSPRFRTERTHSRPLSSWPSAPRSGSSFRCARGVRRAGRPNSRPLRVRSAGSGRTWWHVVGPRTSSRCTAAARARVNVVPTAVADSPAVSSRV